MISKPNLTKDEILQTGLFQSTGGNKELAYYLAERNPMIYLLWAEKARQLGNIEKANEFEQLASMASSKMDTNSIIVNQTQNSAHEKNADVHANKGAFSRAIKEIDLAIKQDVGNAVLYYKKGTFHLSLNELDKSVIALEKAISIDDKMIDAYINLANSKGKQSKFREVISILNEAEKLTNSNAKIYFNRGYAKALVNEVNGAIFDFSKAISLNPGYGQAYILRGRAYMAIGNKNNACSDFNRATELNVPGAREMWQQACK
jgi:tetratricopeptide (TPR) repeat protein